MDEAIPADPCSDVRAVGDELRETGRCGQNYFSGHFITILVTTPPTVDPKLMMVKPNTSPFSRPSTRPLQRSCWLRRR